MTKEQAGFLHMAEESIVSAETQLNAGNYPGFVVSRAYYAMFYAASALLLSRDLSFSKHSAVISAFGKEFTKTGLLPQELHGWLNEASEKRSRGDYDPGAELTAEQAAEQIKRARQFVVKARDFLSKET